MDGISAYDKHLLDTGRKPRWAKKVTEIGPRPKRPATSNSPSEIAMRRVTEPDYRKPFSETDLKAAREGELKMNQRIADILADKVDLKVSASADYVTVADLSKSSVRFQVYSWGPVYKVKIIKSATNQDVVDCKTVADVAAVINEVVLTTESVEFLRDNKIVCEIINECNSMTEEEYFNAVVERCAEDKKGLFTPEEVKTILESVNEEVLDFREAGILPKEIVEVDEFNELFYGTAMDLGF